MNTSQTPYTLFLGCRRPSAAQSSIEDLISKEAACSGWTAHCLQLDLCSRESVKCFCDHMRTSLHSIDTLFLSAGVWLNKREEVQSGHYAADYLVNYLCKRMMM